MCEIRQCDSFLLYSPCHLPKCNMPKLPNVYISEADMLTGTRMTKHITPVLKSLHWLPLKTWIAYKLLATVYKSLYGLLPYTIESYSFAINQR